MCGIFCAFLNGQDCDNLLSCIHDSCENNLARRGPDAQHKLHFKISNHLFLLSGTVLWLQGKQITKQPLDTINSKFLYNGDVFGGSIEPENRKSMGDTKLFCETLENSTEIDDTLTKIKGPYSFIYLCTKKNLLFFGRDVFGRRSLLIGKYRKGNQDITILTSVAYKNIKNCSFIELPAIGTFMYDLETKNITLYPWRRKNENFDIKMQELSAFLECDIKICQELSEIESKSFIQPSEEKLAILHSLKGMKFDEAMLYLCSNELWLQRIQQLQLLLEKAIKERIGTQPKFCKNCIKDTSKICNHALTGVLFSGGIDCAILALLADKFVDTSRPIDLLNVSFDEAKQYQSPDRLTGHETYQELIDINPKRQWNFVEINVNKDELNFQRETTIRHLIYPLNTILDDSLGCALWFASRGISENYETPCNVLLVGMGADELFGGYTRHRNALKRQGWLGLHQSLQEDWQNISYRNLARDDRVVSHHGRQLRTPYLDEDFVEYVHNLQAWEKTYPSEEVPAGFGEKILLRSLGYYLGLKKASSFKKRALQFGSRIANSKENGQDISQRL